MRAPAGLRGLGARARARAPRIGLVTGGLRREEGAVLIDVIVGATIFTGSVVAAGVVFNESSQTLTQVDGRQGAVVLASNVLAQATAYGCGFETGVDLPNNVQGTDSSQPGAPTAASVWNGCSYVYQGPYPPQQAPGYSGQSLGDQPPWQTTSTSPPPVSQQSSSPTVYTVGYQAVWTPTSVANGSQLAAGSASAYAVTSSGNVYAWGANGSGQLGTGNTANQNGAVEVAGPSGSGYLANVVSVAAGSTFALALTSSGTVYAWGSINSSSVPVAVQFPAGVTVSAIAAGGGTALAVASSGTAGGTVYAWGTGTQGQLGNGSQVSSTTPVPVVTMGSGSCSTSPLNGVVAVAEGSEDSYALTSAGTVWAWGAASSGQLGMSSASSPIACAEQVPGLSAIRQVVAGQDFAAALEASGAVETWGVGGSGQLGNGSYSNATSGPVAVVGVGGTGTLGGVDELAAGPNHMVAATSGGTVYAWGSNSSGQLGVASPSQSATPITVGGPSGSGQLNGLAAVAAGQGTSYGLSSSGGVYAWGTNGSGQLGAGSSATSSAQPLAVVQGSSALDVDGVPSGCPTTLSGPGSQPGGQVRTVSVSWNAAGVIHTYQASTYAAVPSDAALYADQADGGIEVTAMGSNSSWPTSSWAVLTVPAAAYISGAAGSTSVTRYASPGGCAWFPFLPPSSTSVPPAWTYTLTYHYYTTNGSGQVVPATQTLQVPAVTSQNITQVAA